MYYSKELRWYRWSVTDHWPSVEHFLMCVMLNNAVVNYGAMVRALPLRWKWQLIFNKLLRYSISKSWSHHLLCTFVRFYGYTFLLLCCVVICLNSLTWRRISFNGTILWKNSYRLLFNCCALSTVLFKRDGSHSEAAGERACDISV